MFNIYSYSHAIIIKGLRHKFTSIVKQIILIALSGKCACKRIICASNIANAELQVDNKHTCDHLVDASIKTIKYLNGPHDGCMSLHILP